MFNGLHMGSLLVHKLQLLVHNLTESSFVFVSVAGRFEQEG